MCSNRNDHISEKFTIKYDHISPYNRKRLYNVTQFFIIRLNESYINEVRKFSGLWPPPSFFVFGTDNAISNSRNLPYSPPPTHTQQCGHNISRALLKWPYRRLTFHLWTLSDFLLDFLLPNLHTVLRSGL